MPDAKPQPHRFRFLTIDDVAEELATSPAQIRALIRRKELPALQIGGRGQWRVERAKLEAYIQASGATTEAELARRRRWGRASSEDPGTRRWEGRQPGGLRGEGRRSLRRTKPVLSGSHAPG